MSLNYYNRLKVVFDAHKDQWKSGLAKTPMKYLEFPELGNLYFIGGGGYFPNTHWFEFAPPGSFSSDDHIGVIDDDDSSLDAEDREVLEAFLRHFES